MKVVLFCGGYGMRLREHSESTPKPMVPIGHRPILWHVMKYYSHFGHKDFILCLGWKADLIKQYFLDYDECMSNDFVLSRGGRTVDLLNTDIEDWNITFVDTAAPTSIGQRLCAVRRHLEGEETFLANYTDGLTDLYLPDLIELRNATNATATFLSVRPTQSLHAVAADSDGTVHQIKQIAHSDVWINGGFFVLSNKIFDAIGPEEDLVAQPFDRLIESRQLVTLKYHGFWSCMDTYKEKQSLDDMFVQGDTPWMVWNRIRAELAGDLEVFRGARESGKKTGASL